jgi:hypothetical protein
MSTSTGVAPTRTTLVARTDIERHQRDQERVGARRDADPIRHTDARRQLTLEALGFRAENESLAVAHPGDGGKDLIAQRRVLGLEV